MLDSMLLATTLAFSALPMQDTTSTVRIVNILAARQARHVPDRWVPFTLCISERESGYGRTADLRKPYLSKNPASSASGRYQFLDTSWRKGGAWNVWKRLIRHGFDRASARRVRVALMETPIRYWRPVWQDVLYAEVLLSGEGKGWRHWHLSGSPCNRLVPK